MIINCRDIVWSIQICLRTCLWIKERLICWFFLSHVCYFLILLFWICYKFLASIVVALFLIDNFNQYRNRWLIAVLDLICLYPYFTFFAQLLSLFTETVIFCPKIKRLKMFIPKSLSDEKVIQTLRCNPVAKILKYQKYDTTETSYITCQIQNAINRTWILNLIHWAYEP